MKNTKCVLNLALFCSLLFSIAASSQAFAQHKTSKLTQSNVKSFINAMTDMTSGVNNNSSKSKIETFLQRHLHDKARFKSEVSFSVPGYPSQTNSMALDKEQFIASIDQGSQSINKYDSTVNISDIRISKDGRKATLKTTTSEQGYMSMPGASDQIPVEGNSSCNQILMLDKKGYIQVYSAICETNIKFQEY